jgi:hypothetical protein
MPPFPLQRPDFDLSLRRVYENAFQQQVLEHLLHLHPTAQEVVLKQGDGGKDIVVYNIGRVYACYAPVRMNDWNEADVIAKIRGDLEKVKANLGDALREWVFVHNHPASALTNRVADFVLTLRHENLGIRYFDVWGIDQLWDQIANPKPEHRRAAYLRAVAAAFRSYQELALDLNYDGADRASPNIWDLFVHPACAETYLRPEDIDNDSRLPEPKHPTFDLITRLAQPEYRRTVLLADPGMGKSTLIQSLLAHLGMERTISGATELDGLLPIPLILRDLVPLLPQDNPEQWTWKSLLNVLQTRYRRGEISPLLLDAYQGDEYSLEFQQLIQGSDKVFFLVDGLDEVGDRHYRRQIVRVIQEGIRNANSGARWLITSRVIGYDDVRMEFVSGFVAADRAPVGEPRSHIGLPWSSADEEMRFEINRWKEYLIAGTGWDEGGDIFQCINTDVVSEEDLQFGRNRHDTPSLKAGGGGYAYRIPVARRLYLAPFNNERQDNFAQLWFQHRHCVDYSAELMREVRRHGHGGIRVIARVPNLLCMMNMLKRSGKPLPDGRHALYREIVKAYNGGIDAVYFRDNPLKPYCPIEPAERTRLLSILGAKMQNTRTEHAREMRESSDEHPVDGNILISRSELESVWSPMIAAMQQSGKIRDPRPAADLTNELLQHISHRSGLLIPRSVDEGGNTVFAFTHLSFLEFFAACYIVEKLIENEKRAERMRRRGNMFDGAAWEATHPPGPVHVSADNLAFWASEPNWREVLIFAAEIRSENQDDLEMLMEDIFPALSEDNTFDVDSKEPMMPFYAVDLAMKLARDQQLNLPPATTERWRHLLWFTWATYSRGRQGLGDGGWPIVNDIEEDWPPISIQTVLLEHGPKHPEARCWGLLNSQTTMNQRDLELLVELLPNLEWLTLADDNEITDLAPIARLTKLKTLDLYGCSDLSDLRPLSGLIKLNWLRIAGTRSLNDLTPLASLPKLNWLDFNSCKDLVDINSLAKLPSLKTLGLAYCREITDVSALFSSTSLKRVEITKCPGIPQEQIDGLRELFPDSRMARRRR